MSSLREPLHRAIPADSKSGQGVGCLHRFPSEEWTAAFKVALNSNRAYREAAKLWKFGPVAIIVRGDPASGVEHDACVIVDVHEGHCREAEFVRGVHDPKSAKFVIVGSYARWKEVIEGKLDPIKAMMQGKLRLTRGHLPTILQRVESARQLVKSACKVPTRFHRDRPGLEHPNHQDRP